MFYELSDILSGHQCPVKHSAVGVEEPSKQNHPLGHGVHSSCALRFVLLVQEPAAHGYCVGDAVPAGQ